MLGRYFFLKSEEIDVCAVRSDDATKISFTDDATLVNIWVT